MTRIVKGFLIILFFYATLALFGGIIYLFATYPWTFLVATGLFLCWVIGGIDDD